MAAAVTAGLLAVPGVAAAAPSTDDAPAKPTVSVSAPSATPQRFTGNCPVTVTFSAKVTLKLDGKTTISYRWVSDEGATSGVKSQTVAGRGTKTVTLTSKETFKKDAEAGWALQLLSPREVTTEKARVSVACRVPGKDSGKHRDDKHKDEKHKDDKHTGKPGHPQPDKPKPEQPKPEQPKPGHPGTPKKDLVAATVAVPDYVGVCPPPEGITATGVIKTARPTWVAYVWTHNGRIVGKGVVHVDGERTVSYTFTPTRSGTGRMVLGVVSPFYGDLARDTYVVTCQEQPPAEPVAASASVTAPEDYAGACWATRVFTGRVSVNRIAAGGTTVEYRWAGPGFQGPVETLTFAEGDPLTKEVAHPVDATETGVLQRWIEILSPNAAESNRAQTQVECAPVEVVVLGGRVRYDMSTCTPGNQPAFIVSADVRVSGATRVEYQWEFLGVGNFAVPGSFEATGPETRTVSHRIESGPPVGAVRARLTVLSPPNVRAWAYDFSPPPCLSA